ncbi:hypothetical protein Belba_0166 [Belliella baltica DSM 15883]|uniref:DUF4221 domain-containing protein n=2 Tax=Belliella TaxID=232244 RepID=I3Z0R9_BELBD|nr:hypothetical protein Belba_0166 [Belliella baltica DSM 15883]
MITFNHQRRSFCLSIIFLFYVSFSILGCSASTDDGEIFEVKEGESIAIKLDHQTSPAEQYTQYIKDYNGKEVYAVHVKNRAAIKLYDLASGELFEEIKIPTTGPDAINSVGHFYIHNQDSIFLNQGLLFKLVLVNRSMEKLDVYDLMPDDIDWDPNTYRTTSTDLASLTFDMKRDFVVINNSIKTQTIPYLYPLDPKMTNVEGLIISVDLASKSFYKFGDFPEEMKNKVWGGFLSLYFLRENSEKGESILSFAASENIFVYNNSQKFNSIYYASSNKIKKISHYVKSDPVQEQEMDYYMNMPVYGGIYHDEKNGYFYRIAKYPNGDNYDPYKSDFLDPMANPRDFCIIVLDKDYKKVTEFDIKQPKDGVYYDMCFANENGLYIPYVDLNNEDVLYFKNFKVYDTK